ncbi:MAG TPA: transaldolase [Acidimicrobiia bacterium]|nr:transaldolase [Acidimicrobiia bacterium]
MNAIARLNEYGQSPWYDNLNRAFITEGGLAHMIAQDGIRGATSNPTIFEKAVGGSDAYDEQFARLVSDGASTADIYWDLMLTDIDKGCETFRSVFDEADGGDGFVSVECDPTIAYDTEATIEQARELHQRVGRPNVMIKIPGTEAGLPAIEQMISEGRNVNVTLIFSVDRYDAVIEAYLRGLERLAENGGDLSRVASVASFFVSRVDTETDRRLPEGHELRGKAAVANARLAYRLFRQRFAGERWQALANQGARLQRPLWASTSTKNPEYSDTLYVDELVGRDTVNTLADDSIVALRDHGDPQPDTVEQGDPDAVLEALAEAGVDMADVTDTLEREGVEKFSQSFHDCMDTLEKRRGELA